MRFCGATELGHSVGLGLVNPREEKFVAQMLGMAPRAIPCDYWYASLFRGFGLERSVDPSGLYMGMMFPLLGLHDPSRVLSKVIQNRSILPFCSRASGCVNHA